jgi:hypothetical protein
MNKYIYTNLPLIYLTNNYSLWLIKDNNILYIYLFKNKEDAFMKITELNTHIINGTYILMNHNLVNIIFVQNYNNNIFLDIKNYIQKTKLKLKNYHEPEWDFFEEKIIDRTFRTSKFDISVDKIINEIISVIRIHSGDVRAIINLISDLKIKFNYSKDEYYYMDEIIHKTTDGLNIIVNINKYSHSIFCDLLGCSDRKIKYTLKYIIVKPGNISAINICNHMINNELKTKLEFIKRYK